ncbi:hypothetical protein [Thiomonas sp. FB-Cd]|uniref:hypothetical protein n=1 Tax=Thiomonas sp. FB-Cd TaxID=1158292 RepID=UPI0018CC514B|nr:hypothetical protein [Thiomonas sp. FB-Cd]
MQTAKTSQRYPMRRALGLAILAVLGSSGASSLAYADGPPVSFQISVGTPPPVYAPAAYYAQPVYPPPVAMAPPAMVWQPQLGVYIALGVQQPIFYLGGLYYYAYGGRWYAGPHYGGPWRPLGGPPPQLRRFEDRDWNRYQDQAREHERDPHWRHFHAAPMPQGRGPERGREQRQDYHPGADRGQRQDRGPGRNHDQGPQRGGNRDGRPGDGRDRNPGNH